MAYYFNDSLFSLLETEFKNNEILGNLTLYTNRQQKTKIMENLEIDDIEEITEVSPYDDPFDIACAKYIDRKYPKRNSLISFFLTLLNNILKWNFTVHTIADGSCSKYGITDVRYLNKINSVDFFYSPVIPDDIQKNMHEIVRIMENTKWEKLLMTGEIHHFTAVYIAENILIMNRLVFKRINNTEIEKMICCRIYYKK